MAKRNVFQLESSTAFHHGREHDQHHRTPLPSNEVVFGILCNPHDLNQFDIYENDNTPVRYVGHKPIRHPN
jgi:hypothetical protein